MGARKDADGLDGVQVHMWAISKTDPRMISMGDIFSEYRRTNTLHSEGRITIVTPCLGISHEGISIWYPHKTN